MIEGIIFLFYLVIFYIFIYKVNKNKYFKEEKSLGLFAYKDDLKNNL